MSQRTATITSLPMAFEVVKAMQADGLDWCEWLAPPWPQALEEIIEGQMAAAVDCYLDNSRPPTLPIAANGYYRRRLLAELGDIELHVPRTRRYSPTEVIRAYARRTREIDRVILALRARLSTRKMGETVLALLGRSVSPSTVSQVAKTLDAAVAAFHRRPPQNRYKALMLDGVVLSRKTGAGALAQAGSRCVGLRTAARRRSSTSAWRRAKAPPNGRNSSPISTAVALRRGSDMICVDGGGGLLAALPGIFHGIPVQRCWAHKIRNILDKVKRPISQPSKRALHKIMNASNARPPVLAASFANRFEDKYSAAVACLRNDLDELLTCFRYKSEDQRRKVRTTNVDRTTFPRSPTTDKAHGSLPGDAAATRATQAHRPAPRHALCRPGAGGARPRFHRRRIVVSICSEGSSAIQCRAAWRHRTRDSTSRPAGSKADSDGRC